MLKYFLDGIIYIKNFDIHYLSNYCHKVSVESRDCYFIIRSNTLADSYDKQVNIIIGVGKRDKRNYVNND